MTTIKALADKALDLMVAARLALVLDQPYFGGLALRLALVPDSSIETACTNGQYIKFNPEYVIALSREERIGLVAHEVLHCTNGHCWRRGSRDPERWNHGADYAINPVLVESGFKLPQDALLDSQYEGRSAEWITDRLPESDDQDSSSSGSGSGFGGVEDSPEPTSQPEPGTEPGTDGTPGTEPGTASDGPMSESDWQQAAEAMERICEGRGTLPGGIKRQSAERKSIMEWRSLLWRFAQSTARNDYSMRRINQRYADSGLYLPSLHSEQLGTFVVVFDTSGSIDLTACAQFTGEYAAVQDELKPERSVFMCCDSQVYDVQEFSSGDVFTPVLAGGGGTSFVPAFDKVRELELEPACLIYFTDLDGTFPTVDPGYPVLWINYGRSHAQAPFGETVRLA